MAGKWSTEAPLRPRPRGLLPLHVSLMPPRNTRAIYEFADLFRCVVERLFNLLTRFTTDRAQGLAVEHIVFHRLICLHTLTFVAPVLCRSQWPVINPSTTLEHFLLGCLKIISINDRMCSKRRLKMYTLKVRVGADFTVTGLG